MTRSPTVIPLRRSWPRFGALAGIFAALGAGMIHLSRQPTLAKPSMTGLGQHIGRTLMAVDRVGGVWPIAAAMGVAFAAGALFLVWVLAAERPSFHLVLDNDKVTWPSLAPWVPDFSLAWSNVASVTRNAAGDFFVLTTTAGRRRVIPIWSLPRGTSADEVLCTMAELHARASGRSASVDPGR